VAAISGCAFPCITTWGEKDDEENVMINWLTGIRAVKRGLLAVFLLISISSVSHAGPLGVPVDPYPSIVADYMTTSYNAATGAFAANGWALTLDTGTGAQSITTPFTLQATIENSGKADSGSMVIGSVTSPLLVGLNLIGFGFSPTPGGVLEFLFGSVAGSYVPGVYSATKPLDVAITPVGTGVGTGFPGSFSTSWFSASNTALISEDGPAPTPTPEPATLLLMLAGGGGLCWHLRKRVGLTSFSRL
jgi:hypothetical protein